MLVFLIILKGRHLLHRTSIYIFKKIIFFIYNLNSKSQGREYISLIMHEANLFRFEK